MRRLALLLLLAPAARADPLVEISSVRWVGEGLAVAAVAAGQGYLPTVLTQRADPRGHWRCVDLRGDAIDEARLRGDAAGMGRHGGGVVFATRRGGEIELTEIRYESARASSIEHGAVALGGLHDPRVLRVGSTPAGPLLVVGHRDGLLVATVKPRGRGQVDRIETPERVVAVAEPALADRDDRIDLYAVDATGRLLHLERRGAGFALAGAHALDAVGLRPRAVAVQGRAVWVAGVRDGRAVLLGFDPGGGWPGRRRGRGGVLALDAGSLDHVAVLDPETLAVAGTRAGRAWVGVVRTGRRVELVHELHLPGTGVVALGVNPGRDGWSLGAATHEKGFHLLLAPGDRPRPRDWSPLAERPREPEFPIPFPPAPRDEPAGEEPPGEAGGGEAGGGERAGGGGAAGAESPAAAEAVLPRIEVDAGRGIETELVLLYLGAGTGRLDVRLLDDTGRPVAVLRRTLRVGERTRLLLSEELARERVDRFDGYARVLGASKGALVVEAVIRRRGEAAETVRAHWR